MDSNSAGTFQKFSPAVRPVRHNSCSEKLKIPQGVYGNRTTILHLHPCIFHYATRKPCEFGLFRSYIRTSSIFAGPGSGAQRTLLHGTATHASIASLRVITWGRMRCLAVLTCHTMLPSPVGPAGSRAARAARAERSCHWRSEKFGVSGFSIRGCDI